MTEEYGLVRLLRQGDGQAAVGLVGLYGERLHRAARRLCGNGTEAQDLTFITLQRALRSGPTFRGESSLYGWLYGILLNVWRLSARKACRSRLVYVEELPEAEAFGAAAGEGLDGEAVSVWLSRALGRLSREHREVIRLHYFGEKRVNDISARLGVRPGTVKSRLFYAVQNLRRLVPEEFKELARGARGPAGV